MSLDVSGLLLQPGAGSPQCCVSALKALLLSFPPLIHFPISVELLHQGSRCQHVPFDRDLLSAMAASALANWGHLNLALQACHAILSSGTQNMHIPSET